MPKRMLIDTSHPEETRVVVLDGNKVEEFDFESAAKRPLKGNIYLAKVTRVEPSLQAAFVEYGGNRQGFLAFSEIHPDYYQIPVADREALLREAELEARKRSDDDIESFDIGKTRAKPAIADAEDDEDAEEETESEAPAGFSDIEEKDEDEGEDRAPESETESETETEEGQEPPAEVLPVIDIPADSDSGVEFALTAPQAPPQTKDEDGQPAQAESAGPAQALQSKRPSQRWMKKRHYKIQEVIKRRQIILVQVVKEERGNKGAALTTYLSLAGRYCVLMPNTPRGGGISRKITNAADRKRLKAAAQSLDLPEGMGLIIRTAGGNRTKMEIKRDYEYLLRMWDTIRETTLTSSAPACVYEEGDLVKRAIRDLYNKDVTEVLVEGDDGYRGAKDFMRMLMPSHAKNVKAYKEQVPLFQRFHIEAQLDSMFSPTVTLKSGGYIVINQTEALVAIDVNSGRATKEHSIEDTATKTNLEAADEIARQLRLRDLAGLIVIDFIDMEDGRNDRLVEKRLMGAVKNDRARIQIGKISQFGLLEMSRQRLRAGVIAGSTVTCPHCAGTGLVRSVESTSLRVLRGIEEEAQKQRAESLNVKVAGEVALYILNQKRAELTRIETEHDIAIAFEPYEKLQAGEFDIDRIGHREAPVKPRQAVTPDSIAAEPVEIEAEEPEEEEKAEVETESEGEGEGKGDTHKKRRRRRRGGRGRSERENEPRTGAAANDAAEPAEDKAEQEDGAEDGVAAGEARNGEAENDEAKKKKRRRRRGRRGGRDRGGDGDRSIETEAAQDRPAPVSQPEPSDEAPAARPAPPIHSYEDRFGRIDEIDTTPQEDPRRQATPVSLTARLDEGAEAENGHEPLWSFSPKPEPETAAEPEAAMESADGDDVPDEETKPVRKGWWQRAFKG